MNNCTRCRHLSHGVDYVVAYCDAPMSPMYRDTAEEVSADPELCGPQGAWFEPKQSAWARLVAWLTS